MISNATPEMIRLLRKIELSLIENRFDINGRLSPAEIRQIVTNYLHGHEKISLAPNEYVASLQAIEVDNSTKPTWHIDYDLWINEKHSDLTLSVEIVEVDNEFTISLLDIHVM